MCDRQFGEVMSLVIRVINFIVARALNDRQFKTLLDEVNNYPGLLLHSNVRWLSRGKVLSRFAACLNEIRTFLEMKGVGHPELADTEWLLKFYYLVDLTEHLNQLNVKMQGIGNTVLSLQQAVFAFENKLELFITDLETGRLLHFEKLSQFKDACTASEPIQNLDLHQLAGCTSSLLQSFKARFGEFREHTRLFKFITHPNECSLNTADLNYIPGVSVRDFEAEVADLKASDMWVNKFKSLNEDLERITRQKAELASKHMWTEMKKLQPEDQLILKTWNALPVTYHTLQRKFRRVFEGIAKAGQSTDLNDFYTELFITERLSGEVNKEHEVRLIETASRKPAKEETPFKCEDIFKPLPGKDQPSRTIMTTGVAGIGKTILTHKFTLDWAEGKANQDIHFTLPFTFRELNLLKEKEFSLVELLHHFFIQTKGIRRYDLFQVVFILDGLDECRLPLDFQNNPIWTDVTKSTSVDVLLTNLIRGDLLPSARIWITTRPAAANQIPAECVGMVTEVRGFTDPQKEEYFRKRFREETLASTIISHIKTSRSLHIMCHIP
ncbi:hypothetical protein NHX12_015751, partial [Muraenolepis orangiensis]